MVEVVKIMATSFKRSHAGSATLTAPSSAAGHHQTTPLPETPGHSWASLCQSLVCALQESVSPVPCKFWRLYIGVNGDLLQEDLCHSQVCCTQSPCPCSRPLLTHTSAGDTQTQFWLSLCGVSGCWCAQGLLESSEHLWRVWDLILNVILRFLSSCSGFSFALGYGVSFFGVTQHSLWMVAQQLVVMLEFS